MREFSMLATCISEMMTECGFTEQEVDEFRDGLHWARQFGLLKNRKRMNFALTVILETVRGRRNR